MKEDIKVEPGFGAGAAAGAKQMGNVIPTSAGFSRVQGVGKGGNQNTLDAIAQAVKAMDPSFDAEKQVRFCLGFEMSSFIAVASDVGRARSSGYKG